MCLSFFSLVRHVSQICDTVSHLFQLGETCVSPFSIPGSNTGVVGAERESLWLGSIELVPPSM